MGLLRFFEKKGAAIEVFPKANKATSKPANKTQHSGILYINIFLSFSQNVFPYKKN